MASQVSNSYRAQSRRLAIPDASDGIAFFGGDAAKLAALEKCRDGVAPGVRGPDIRFSFSTAVGGGKGVSEPKRCALACFGADQGCDR